MHSEFGISGWTLLPPLLISIYSKSCASLTQRSLRFLLLFYVAQKDVCSAAF